jgi:hypothetical protein
MRVPASSTVPVPYTPEEQIIELTQALKLNQQRHCFIQLPGQETQPLLIPFVNEFYVTNDSIKRFVKRKAEASGAITPEEADERISQSVEDLLLLRDTATDNSPAGESAGTDNPLLTTVTNKSKESKEKKSTIFDRIKEANPDADI